MAGIEWIETIGTHMLVRDACAKDGFDRNIFEKNKLGYMYYEYVFRWVNIFDGHIFYL